MFLKSLMKMASESSRKSTQQRKFWSLARLDTENMRCFVKFQFQINIK